MLYLPFQLKRYTILVKIQCLSPRSWRQILVIESLSPAPRARILFVI